MNTTATSSSLKVQSNLASATLYLEGRLISSADGDPIQQHVSVLSQKSALVILNLEKLEYINSMGLNELIKIFTILRTQNKELEIHGVSTKIRELLIMTKLSSIFTIK